MALVLLSATLWLLHPAKKRSPSNLAVVRFALVFSALIWLGCYAFGPVSFLGAGYFAQRMSIPAVVLFLAAQAGLIIPLRARRMVAIVSLGTFTWMLVVREQQTAIIEAELAKLYELKPVCNGCTGAIVGGTELPYLHGRSFDPYYWAGADYARRQDAILLNTPWLGGAIALFTVRMQSGGGYEPRDMSQTLAEDPSTYASRIAFLCGQKWNTSQEATAHAGDLARGLGLVQILKSKTYDCYGK